jgi:hypothetical protein
VKSISIGAVVLTSFIATAGTTFGQNQPGGAAGAAKPSDGAANKSGADGGGPIGANEFFKDWGTGLALIRNNRRAVSDASIVGGVVRVTSQSSYDVSLLVARHFYPFKPDGDKCVTSPPTNVGYWTECVGMMVGVGLGSSGGGSGGGTQLINMVGLGVTYGGGVGPDKSTSWRFGLGVGRKFGAKVLGDGFSENAPPPSGETQVRYKTQDTTAPFLFFTVHW